MILYLCLCLFLESVLWQNKNLHHKILHRLAMLLRIDPLGLVLSSAKNSLVSITCASFCIEQSSCHIFSIVYIYLTNYILIGTIHPYLDIKLSNSHSNNMFKRGRSAILSVWNVIFLDSLTCYVVKLWIRIVDCKVRFEYEILSIHGQHNMLDIL